MNKLNLRLCYYYITVVTMLVNNNQISNLIQSIILSVSHVYSNLSAKSDLKGSRDNEILLRGTL